MAITRTQIAKQLLAQGGRTGFFKGAQADASAGRGSMSPGTSGTGGMRDGGGRERGMEQSRLEAQRRSDLKSLARMDAEEKFEERLEPFRRLNSPQRQFANFIKKISPIANIASAFGPLNNRDFLVYNALSGRNAPMSKEQFANLSLEEQDEVLNNYLQARNRGEIDAYFNPIDQGGGEGSNILLPETMTAQAPSITEQVAEGDSTDERLFRRFAAEGGSMNPDVVGGEMDFESARQMYGLGKLVKKVTRTVKKIAKSPIGKAALLYAGTAGLGALGAGATKAGSSSLFGFLRPTNVLSNLMTSGRNLGILKSKFPFGEERVGPLSKLGIGSLIGGASALSGLLTKEEEDDEDEDTTYRGEGLDIPMIRRDPQGFLAPRFLAEGGSTEKEPVAKKTMPLLDMDGKEKDYRETGGFVDMGRMEKADDVPARLSKNEFVFTADAVRNAGDGSVDKGAEVMYNMMKNLEAGGEVSEESQGLEGARKMFQTSQRLEEVI